MVDYTDDETNGGDRLSLQQTLEKELTTSKKLSQADTRRFLDDYMRYRFGQVLSEQDFAKQAGVPESAIKDLFAQKQISNDDLSKIAKSLDISTDLLGEIAGYQKMSDAMHQTLDRFFKASAGQ